MLHSLVDSADNLFTSIKVKVDSYFLVQSRFLH